MLSLKRFIYKISYPVAARILHWVNPNAVGASCAIVSGGKLLLIRRSYGSGIWDLPGGRIGNKEASEEAVRREVKEEVGITLGAVKLFGEHFGLRESGARGSLVHCFYVKVPNENFKIGSGEIAEAKWVNLDKVPEFHTRSVVAALKFLDPERQFPAHILENLTIF